MVVYRIIFFKNINKFLRFFIILYSPPLKDLGSYMVYILCCLDLLGVNPYSRIA